MGDASGLGLGLGLALGLLRGRRRVGVEADDGRLRGFFLRFRRGLEGEEEEEEGRGEGDRRDLRNGDQAAELVDDKPTEDEGAEGKALGRIEA